MRGKERVTTPIFLALLVEWIGLEMTRRIEGLAPLLQYGIAVVLGIVSFIFLYYGFSKIIGSKMDFLESKFFRVGIVGGVVLLNVFCVCWASSQLSERFPEGTNGVLETYPLYWLIPVYVILFGICLYIYKNKRIGDRIYVILAVFLGLFVIASKYIPNIFHYDLYHAPAYTNSIYNVLAGYPYDSVTQNIYGHYGIFYYLPVKALSLFWDKTTALYVMICFASVFSWYCMVRVIRIIVRNKGMRLIALLALTWQFTRSISTYWAMCPHRFLFPNLLLFYCVKKRKNRNCGGWFICACSILWNLETGLTCTIAYVGFQLIRTLQKESLISRKFFESFLKQAICAAGAFVGSYIGFNLYNLVAGGTWQSIRCYIYPIGSTYHISGLNVELPMVYNSYAMQILLFTAAFCFALARVKIFSKDKIGVIEKDNDLLVLLALEGLGTIMYYINRAAVWNLDISYLPSMCLLILLSDRILDRINPRTFFKLSLDDMAISAGAVLAFAVVSVFAFFNVAAVGNLWTDRTKFMDEMAALDSYADKIESIIPKNTYAFGHGVQELYGRLGWDPKCHTIDYSGYVPDGVTYMQEELKDKDVETVFCEKSEQYLLEDLPYETCLEIGFPAGWYVYMVRKDCLDSPEVKNTKYAYAALNLWWKMELEEENTIQSKELQAALQEKDGSVLEKQLELFQDYDDATYVHTIYQCIFGREPTEEEAVYCQWCLSTGTSRTQLLLAVMDSRITGEFCNTGMNIAIEFNGVGAKKIDKKGTENWRSAEQHGFLILHNYTNKNTQVKLSGRVSSIKKGNYRLTLIYEDEKRDLLLSNEATDLEWTLNLKPGSNYLYFSTDAPQRSEKRKASFKYINLSVDEAP